MNPGGQKKFNAFKPASLSDWEVAAREELKGADPWKTLEQTAGGLPIRPYYFKNERSSSIPLLRPAQNSFLGPRTWYNCPLVRVESEKKSNEEAREHLSNGADGVFFELPDKIELHTLLHNLDGKYCSLNFLAKKNSEAVAKQLSDFFQTKKEFNQYLPGAFFGNTSTPQGFDGVFRSCGYAIPQNSSPVDEIVSFFKFFGTKSASELKPVWGKIAVSVNLDPDFFLSIAKLRAFRVVWQKFAKVKGAPASELFIHACSPPWSDKRYQPHENMLSSTTSAIAAILGGCDVLTLMPESDDHNMMNRVARNVSNILREESQLARVADPVGGSYFIETLTGQIADASWSSIETGLT